MMRIAFTLFAILLIFAASVARAAVTISIESFDTNGDSEDTFVIGEQITLRLLAIDSTGDSPDFTTDLLATFNAQILANTNDGDDGVASGAYHPGFVLTAPPAGSFLTGVNLGGSAGATPFRVDSPATLFEFSYTADVIGSTDYSLNPAVTNIAFVEQGNTAPTIFLPELIGQSVNVTAVPEPSSVFTLLCGSLAFLDFRKKAKPASARGKVT